MKNIADEIRECLEKTGRTQLALARQSRVPASTICNLLKGRRKAVIGPAQDALREAMRLFYEENGL